MTMMGGIESCLGVFADVINTLGLVCMMGGVGGGDREREREGGTGERERDRKINLGMST